MSSNGKITIRQLQVLIFISALGTGAIVLPRRAAEYAGQDGWIIAIVLGLLGMVLGGLVFKAGNAAIQATREAREQSLRPVTFMEVTSLLLSKPVAYILGVVLWVKLVFGAGFQMRAFLEITKDILLPNTPIPVVGAVMLLLCAYAAAKGIETRARVAEVLLAIMVLPFLFLFVIALFDVDFSNLKPLIAAHPSDVASGVIRLGFIFTGLECLLLVPAFVKGEKPPVRAVVGVLALAGVVITIITIITIAALGQGISTEPWPVLRMMDMLNLPGSFIERQEALVLSFWIITAFALGNTLLFFGGTLIKGIFIKQSLCTSVIITTAAVFAVTFIPLPEENIYLYLDYMYMTTGIFFLVVLPLILLAAAKLHNWGRRHEKPTTKIIIAVLILASTAALTSCWDSIEIEDRVFVTAIGIDKAEGQYTVILSIPEFDKEAGESKPHTKSVNAATIAEAIKKFDSEANNKLYYGHIKLLLLGADLLKDEGLLRETINTLDNMKEINGNIQVASTKDLEKALSEIKPGEPPPGLFTDEKNRGKNNASGKIPMIDDEAINSDESKKTDESKKQIEN